MNNTKAFLSTIVFMGKRKNDEEFIGNKALIHYQ